MISNPQKSIYTVGGTVQAGDGIYIPRQADDAMLEHCQAGDFAYVLAARQLGKSSLMVRTAEQLKKQNICTVVMDLTELGVQATAAEWYLGLIIKISFELALDVNIFEWWMTHEQVGLTQRMVMFFQDIVLKQIDEKLVIFIDEIDSTLSLDFTDDFFAAVRYIYNGRATNPEFNRLSFVLIGVATPGDLINDPKRTPFNIGARIELNDFSFAEAKPLAVGLSANRDEAHKILKYILHWTDGHPYLTQRLCRIVSEQQIRSWSAKKIEYVVRDTFFEEMSYADSNLQFIRDMLTKRAPDSIAVLKTYRDIRARWQPVYDDEQSLIKTHLKLSGVVRREANILRVRNRIYEHVFNPHWIREYLPQNWWRQLPTTIKFAAVAILVLLVALTIMALIATTNAQLANDRAQLAHARYLIAQSEPMLDSQYDLALLLSLEAQHLYDSAETRANVRDSLNHNPYLKTFLRAHDDLVNNITYAPSGELLASAAGDNQIILWDMRTDDYQYRKLSAHPNGVNGLAFNSDGSILASGGCLQFDERKEACTQGEISIWQMDDLAKPVVTIPAHNSEVWSLAFNHDNSYLATSSTSQLIIWETKSWDPVWEFNDANKYFSGIDFHPYIESMLAIGGADGMIRIMDVESGDLLQELPAHNDRIYKAEFSPDGRLLAASSKDSTVTVWVIETWEQLHTFINHNDQIVHIDFSPDSRRLASAGLDGQVIIWDIGRGGESRLQLTGHQGSARHVNFHPDVEQNMLVSTGPNNSIILWDLDGDRTRQARFAKESDAILSLDYSHDGTVLAYSGESSAINLWNMIEDAPIDLSLVAHENAVRRVRFDPTGRYLASAGRDHKVILWYLAENLAAPPLTLNGHTSIVRSVDFSPDGQMLASGSDDGQLIIWDTESGEKISNVSTGDHALFDIAFDPAGQILAIGRWDGTIQLWDVDSLQPIGEPIDSGVEQVWDIAFNPQGNVLGVVGSSEKIVFVDVIEHQIASELSTGHTNRINALAFNPEGTMLVSGGADKLIMLWDLSNQQMIGDPIAIHTDQVYAVTFSPDGRTLVSGDLAGNLFRSTIQYESPNEFICDIVNRNLTLSEWNQYIGGEYDYEEVCPTSSDKDVVR